MADKKPIGHGVKGSNGRDVHTVGPLVARRAGLKDAHGDPELDTGTRAFRKRLALSYLKCFTELLVFLSSTNGPLCRI